MKIEKGKYYKYINSAGNYVHTVYATSDRRNAINERPEFSGIVVLATIQASWEEGHESTSWICDRFVESDMTELVEEARKRFPEGSRYHSVDAYGNGGSSYTVTRIPNKYLQNDEWTIEGGNCFLLYKGRWAEPFLKEEKEKVMEKQTLTREQVKEIYDIACPEWQKKIENYVLDNSTAFSNKIPFDNEMVSKMFKAATGSQLPVLKRLFKEPEPQMEFNPSNVYIYKGLTGCGTYKLHRLNVGTYAWIDIYSSDCYANGIHQSGHTALQSILKQGCKVKVLKSSQEVINYFKSLL